MDHRAVDLRIPASAFLVSWPAAISDHGDNEPVLDLRYMRFVAGEQCDGPDRARHEQKSIAESRPHADHPLGEMGQQRDARTIVVGQRGMADMDGQQKFIVRFSLMQILAIGQMAICKARVDDHLISLVAQRLELSMGQAKCPIFRVIGRSIRDEIGLIGQRI